MAKLDKSNAIEILQQTVRENPNLWQTRKKTAKLLFEEERFLEAADTVWGAPEIPSTDVDIAFAISIIARNKPNRAIRLIYEVIRRNHDKPEKNMAVAKALNDLGLYMEAARFYGAALAHNSALFDLGFERQMLWSDDSGKLIKAWRKSDQESKPPLDVKEQKLEGLIKPAVIPEDPLIEALTDAGVTPIPKPATPVTTSPPAPESGSPSPQTPPPVTVPLSTPALGATGPLQPPAPPQATPAVAASATPAPVRGIGTQPLAVPASTKTQALLTPGAGAPKRTLTQPLLTPGAGAPRKVLTQPLLTPGAGAPRKVLTQPLAASNPALKKILTKPLATPGVNAPAAQPPSASGAPAPRQILTQPLLPPPSVPAPPNPNALPPASPIPQPPQAPELPPGQ